MGTNKIILMATAIVVAVVTAQEQSKAAALAALNAAMADVLAAERALESQGGAGGAGGASASHLAALVGRLQAAEQRAAVAVASAPAPAVADRLAAALTALQRVSVPAHERWQTQHRLGQTAAERRTEQILRNVEKQDARAVADIKRLLTNNQ